MITLIRIENLEKTLGYLEHILEDLLYQILIINI